MEDLVQKLGTDFEHANVLSISEVAHLMKKIKEEEPESRVFHQVQFEKIYQYVDKFNSFKDFDVTFQVRKLLDSYEFPGQQRFDNLEIALLSNLCPENAEQARALIPSLHRLGNDEMLNKVCDELLKLKRLSSG
jgi:DNA-directed RNA polymerase II subunit RPB4